MAGKRNYPLPIGDKKPGAPQWQTALVLENPPWGIDVPFCRIRAQRPTFGSLLLVCFRKSTTRSYSLMHCSQGSMRGADIWPIGKQHHLRASFWKRLKAICHMRSMQRPGEGLYTALLIKI
jgi:hypothetical protein